MASLEDYGNYQATSQDVQILREWIEKMPHIVQDYDDEFLASFINCKKGSLQKAKIALEKFNNAGFRFPEYFGHLDILNPTTQKCLKEGLITVLPKRLSNGAHVILAKMEFKDNESKKQNLLEICRYLFMTYCVLNWEHQTYTKNVTIVDLKTLSLWHAKEVTPVFIVRLLETLTYAPVRITTVYIIHFPPALQWIMNMVKMVLKKKIADRFHFISSIEGVYETVPREILPKDLGGGEDDMITMNSKFMKKVISYRDRLIQENMKMRKLDPLRPKEEEVDEMVGTFKALNVD